jgi:hypothetical protein
LQTFKHVDFIRALHSGVPGRSQNHDKPRSLTLEMIRRLVAQLDLPADVLVKPYLLREELLAA